MDNINIYVVSKSEKFLDTKIEGFYYIMEFKGKEVNGFKVFDTSKDIEPYSLTCALELLKSDKFGIKLHTNFIKSKEELDTMTDKKKNKKLLNLVSKYNITSIEAISDERLESISLELDREITIKKDKYNKLYNELKEIAELKNLIVLEKVEKSDTPRESHVRVDEFTDITKKCFDFEFNGVSEFYPFNKPTNIPKEFNIGVIVGASGTGKSTLLSEFGKEEVIEWDNTLSIISHFDSPNDGVDKLTAVGLNSIPSWVKPYEVLSTGEKFRANLARQIKDNAVIDEFTSVVDRNVAKATSTAFSKYVKRNDIKNIVISTCHEDIIEWLEPDWIFNTNEGVLYSGESLRRPRIELEIYETKDYEVWRAFKDHHYLSADLNKASRKFIAMWEGQVVGFSATLPIPSGTIKNGWRGHRTVIFPDFQGLGLGVRFSDAIGQIHIDEGKRYYSKTAHVRMGEYREKSSLWKPTSKNKKQRKDMQFVYSGSTWAVDQDKVSYSHEYIGKQD